MSGAIPERVKQSGLAMIRDRIGIDHRLLEIDEAIMKLFEEREALKSVRVSNENIADKLHVSPATVHGWAHGRIQD